MSGKENLSVVVTMVSNIPCEMLFQSWIDPTILPLWLAPAPYQLVGADVDAKLHGAYSHYIEGPDGTHTVTGSFVEFAKPFRLKKSWVYRGPNPNPRPEPTFVDVMISAEDNGKTHLTLTHSGLRDDAEKNHYGTGWKECFVRLENYWLSKAAAEQK